MGGGSSGIAEARRARIAEEKREERIRQGTAKIRNQFATSYDEPYFDKLEKTVGDYYMKGKTGVDQQYKDALQQMRYAMLRAGNYDSTAFGTRQEKANDAYLAADADVKERARGMANQRRSDVASAENVTLNQLIASGDANAAAIQAANQIAANYKDPQIPPLGMVFQNVTAGLSTQADLERRNQNRYNVFGRIPGWGGGRYTTNVGS